MLGGRSVHLARMVFIMENGLWRPENAHFPSHFPPAGDNSPPPNAQKVELHLSADLLTRLMELAQLNLERVLIHRSNDAKVVGENPGNHEKKHEIRIVWERPGDFRLCNRDVSCKCRV